jgi:hypothetical protein
MKAMSIQPAKISSEDHSSEFQGGPPGYIESAVQWIGRKVLRIKYPSDEEELKKQDQIEKMNRKKRNLIVKINQRLVCPEVLFRQFVIHVPRVKQTEVLEKLGRGEPLSYKDRLWNRFFRDESQIKRRYREIGKCLATKNPYLLAPSLIQALSFQGNASEVSFPDQPSFVRRVEK